MLTQAQVDLLRKPFAVQDHEHREGGKDGLLTYITEEPLIERLNEVDMCWSFKVISIIMSDYGGERPDTVTVHAELTISDITRANVGTAIAEAKLYDWRDGANGKRERYKLDTPEIQTLGEKDIKGAVTDALKRCARMFGVGGYLLRLKGVTIRNEQDFARWYANEFRVSQPQSTDPEFWTKDTERVKTMIDKAENLWKISGAHLYTRLAKALELGERKVTRRDDLIQIIGEYYTRTPFDAWAAIETYESAS